MAFVWETPEEIDLALAKRLAGVRKRRGLSQEQLSEKSNVSLGGSSGGARPKVMTDEWIIKFPASGDTRNVGVMEKEYMDAAAACGIIAPERKMAGRKISPTLPGAFRGSHSYE